MKSCARPLPAASFFPSELKLPEEGVEMHFVVFGLCISSSWGNGHATLWRGLVKALVRRGHTLTFYEKDVPYYASTRDGWIPPSGIRVCVYAEIAVVVEEIKRELTHADV